MQDPVRQSSRRLSAGNQPLTARNQQPQPAAVPIEVPDSDAVATLIWQPAASERG